MEGVSILNLKPTNNINDNSGLKSVSDIVVQLKMTTKIWLNSKNIYVI